MILPIMVTPTMIDPQHHRTPPTPDPVSFHLSRSFARRQAAEAGLETYAPTILGILGIELPAETGRDLREL